AEAAGIDGLDGLEREILLEPVGHVEMAAGAHANRDRHVLEILGRPDLGVRPHEDRPGRDPVGIRHHLAHAGAGVADRAPDAGALDHVALVLGIGPVPRALETVDALRARLWAAAALAVGRR